MRGKRKGTPVIFCDSPLCSAQEEFSIEIPEGWYHNRKLDISLCPIHTYKKNEIQKQLKSDEQLK